MNENYEIMMLKMQIAELQEKVDNMCHHRTIAELCNNTPYTAIRYRKDKGVYFSKMKCDAWNALREVSKTLFLLDKNICSRNYDCITRTPKKVKDMTVEQQQIAAKFIDECITIYNRYFVEVNKDIFLDGEPYEVVNFE